jgi:ribosomal protein S27AE
MGGHGSTRWKNHTPRPLAEESFAWPIKLLYPAIRRALASGKPDRSVVQWQTVPDPFRVPWPQSIRVMGSCGVVVVPREGGLWVALVYTRRVDDIHEEIREGIRVVQTASPLPNNPGDWWRWWWQCPACGRRVVKLFNPSGRWRCGRCAGVVYASSNRYDPRPWKIPAGLLMRRDERGE